MTESQALTALRALLIAAVGAGIPVVQGQDNRVPEPIEAEFIVFTPMHRAAVSSVVRVFDPITSKTTFTQQVAILVQVSVHGDLAFDLATRAALLMSSGFATEFLAARSEPLQILEASDARQSPFLNAQQQVERMWSFDVRLQGSFSVSFDQQSALELGADVINVDAEYPPE